MSNSQSISTATTQADIAAAREVVLRQVEFYSEWLFLQCRGTEQVQERRVLRDKTAEDFVKWPVAWLVALSMDFGQPASTRCAALEAIGERFLADDDTQAEIIRVANKLAQYRMEADEQDRRESRAEHARVMRAPALELVGSDA